MRNSMRGKKNVLVAVLKSRRDMDFLLFKKWYRIPCDAAPKRSFCYLAFYQPVCFAKDGKRIMYYARVRRIERRKRRVILPREHTAPRAECDYFQIYVSHITKLARVIKNTTPRRISFGFTTLWRLTHARNILELYNVAPIEAVVSRALTRAGINAIPQYRVSNYRLDFAIFFHDKKVAIECDNKKAHSIQVQRKKDSDKDAFLRRSGWRVIRLTEEAVLLNIDACVVRVLKAIS